MGEKRGVYRVLVGNLTKRDPAIDGRIILRWIFRKWTESSWLRIGTGGENL
jgi:hypothetical protein